MTNKMRWRPRHQPPRWYDAAPIVRRSAPEPVIPPRPTEYDSRGRPITLPKVSLVERYNEDGTLKE